MFMWRSFNNGKDSALSTATFNIFDVEIYLNEPALVGHYFAPTTLVNGLLSHFFTKNAMGFWNNVMLNPDIFNLQ